MGVVAGDFWQYIKQTTLGVFLGGCRRRGRCMIAGWSKEGLLEVDETAEVVALHWRQLIELDPLGLRFASCKELQHNGKH